MFYVYLLESHNGCHYVGSTNDLKRRIHEHNSKQNIATKANAPWVVIFYEAYVHKADSLRREKYLKTTQGRQALSRMLKEFSKKQGRALCG